ncbi:MAG: SPOR domain-containing protein [Betaproteobacteria bacterium]|nr:SPOR domain-containing protein [Betaproteobacteria bacterium]
MVVGVFVGLVIGALLAVAVAWYVTRAVPFKPRDEDKPAETRAPAAADQQPLPLPGKPGDKPGERPRFEFYKILPGNQDVAPAAAAPAPAAPPLSTDAAPQAEAKPQPEKKTPDEVLYLQVGSFSNPADAENLKAKLAFVGLEAQIQPVDVADRGLMHRVRIGPYRKPEDMNRARTLLAQNGMQAAVVRGR